jgi:hypothetical protein
MGANMALHSADYQIRWKNFRGFVDTGWIKIKPLTILIGANNSGKTSVFAPLLLMAQTINSHDSRTHLITRGPLVDAGLPLDILRDRQENLPLYFGFKFHLHHPEKELKPIGNYPPGVLEVQFKADKSKTGFQLHEYRVSDVYDRPLFEKCRNIKGQYPVTSRVVRMTKKEREAALRAMPVNFLFSANTVLRRERVLSKFSDGFTLYLGSLGFTFGALNDVFRSMAYVGPLRTPPRRS